ncbi:hypothetical protein TRFO_08586 [Tritrichomonas foetus]|uniref:E3 ubiquitin-protein ligase CHFR n=1 Tax=Tritrichomonas foetus TaxID=1144522 RepID=A0A1J4JK91_9EUKA|nr:hypothetical protein TRFO_08586 [Tritrichomonas foetus]|eukprot:OHS99033.1 hypothetical protein TRFO_08586 [Tritrichomonas foetus]
MLIRKSNITNYKIPPFIVLNKDKVSFGRRGDVMLDTNQGQEISKIHAYMFMQHRLSKDTWIIEDNYSLNGTYVNKRKIHRQLLCNGDEIVFGAGSIFGYGDRVISTEKAECRYIFYSIPPKVQFYHQIDKNKSIAFKKETEVCPICLEVIEDEVLLLCGHSFCRKCIQKWETECKYCFRSCSCPVCRTEFKLNYCSDISYNNGIILVYSLEYLFRDI